MGPTAVSGDAETKFSSHRERERMLTVMARFVGVGYLAYFLVSIPDFGLSSELVAGWYLPLAAALAFGPGFALLAATFLPGAPRTAVPLAYLCAAGYLAAGLLWLVAVRGTPAPIDHVAWLTGFAGLPSLAVVLHRLQPAVLVLVLCDGVAGLMTLAAGIPGTDTVDVAYQTVWNVLFTSLFLLAMYTVVRAGWILDRTRAGAVRAAADSATAAARNSERSRFDALIHDRVIATLLAAKRDPEDPRLPDHAQAALDELAALADGPVADGTRLSVAETVARLRTLASSIEADVPVGSVADGDLDVGAPRYPEAAVRAVSEAMGEALRNSVHHAGDTAERAILVEPGPDGLLVTVADNGAGFDVAAVPPERLGIEVSIRSRLQELPGGSAHVRSAPGSGATVQIRWEGAR
ncbi:sensor histidine kinase [Gordonia caeni]|uniref:Histidine kinase/HSP90-like ATPase domain-containing protein n=1 Tax=Gordonia caeni TaxID=1007097 RepID=A0ABP7NS05_9ACTN